MFISKEWKYWYIFAIIISVICLPFVYYIPESPKYLYEKGRFYELRSVIKRIAKTNGVKMDENYEWENSSISRSYNEDKSGNSF